MKITTINPVIIDDVQVDPIDMYLPADGNTEEETYSEGDIKITTMNPVVINDKNASPSDYYSNAGGSINDATSAALSYSKQLSDSPSMESQLKAKKRGEFWNKAKGVWEKISNSPAAQFALQQLSNYLAQKQGMAMGAGMDSGMGSASATTPPPPPKKEKMSTGVKIALGVGGALVLGLIIYAVMSSDSKSKTTK